MVRDLTMIGAVLASLVSVVFGVYKNIEAGNAKAFAYEQAYRVMGVVEQTNLSATAKANLLTAALGVLTTPQPVLDFSRGSADGGSGTQACTEEKKTTCATLASDLAGANATCAQMKNVGDACVQGTALTQSIVQEGCVVCYTQ